MLNVEVKAENVIARFEAMTKSLETFGTTDMPQELTNWQIDDMHRKYPETKVEDNSASTMIYPRSRTYEQTHPHRAHPRPKRQLASMPVLKTSGMRHPILRPVLFDKLHTRMTALLDKLITWQSTSR